MEIQLYTCIPMNARITPTQCDRNRNGVPHAPGKPGRPACLSCTGCPGLGDQQPVNLAITNDTSDTPAQKQEDVMSNKKITCKTCKRENLVLASAGECGRCYGRRRAGKDPLTNEPIAVVPAVPKTDDVDNVGLLSIQKPTTETPVPSLETALEQCPEKPTKKREPRLYPTPEHITLQFTSTRDADLFVKLQCLAATHRRSLEAEILFQLEDRVMHIENVYLSILDNKDACHG